GSIVFEHKLWNEALAENVRNGNLEPHYIWQLEQLILVSDAERAIFVCSDGTTENMAWVWYLPQPGLTDQLLAGWAQFKKDLDEFEAAPAVEVIEATVADLPVITASVSGTEISTNIQEVIAQVKEFAAAELARPLETDLDFANKESLVKKVKAARAALKNKVADIRSGFGSFEEFSSAAAEADKVLQQLQSASEKAVKSEKEN
ncbi:MAG: hypothetical protein OIF35_08645, partial [Cellvibrionaceae bacterium]|nr:hypothetical protein [Cellvibrionaceae bacterium]